MLTGTIAEIAEQAECILQSVAKTAHANPQECDNRIDCLIKLPDGSVVGEMISLDEATEERIKAAGVRLQLRLLGARVPLVNELRAPIRISAGSGPLLDLALADLGAAPKAEELRRVFRVWPLIRAILDRGTIRTDSEHDLVKGIASDASVSPDQSQRLEALLAEYETRKSSC